MSRYLEHVYDGGEVALVPPHDGEAGEAEQEQGAGHHPLASVRSETGEVSSSDTLLTSPTTAVARAHTFANTDTFPEHRTARAEDKVEIEIEKILLLDRLIQHILDMQMSLARLQKRCPPSVVVWLVVMVTLSPSGRHSAPAGLMVGDTAPHRGY